MATELWPALLLAVAGLHAGFQATVTLLVYPALAEVPPERWHDAHDRHSRRIVPLVAVVYVALLVTGVGAVAGHPSSVLLWVATLASAGAVLVTATAAAPLHGRLGSGRDPALVARLLVVDRLRCGCATLGFAAAVLAVTTR